MNTAPGSAPPIFRPVGEAALCVQLGDGIDPQINRRVVALAQDLDTAPIPGILETVPTYRSLLVTYDPEVTRGAALEPILAARIDALVVAQATTRLWHVPVAYGGTVGQDLDALAADKGMTPDALIDLHASVEYRVYMIGFAPGFAYLGGLPDALHTPRLATPRLSIPAGAIGIGGQQASINSVPGPSGWRFIGWTPWRAFDPSRPDPFLFAAGDRLRFVPTDPGQAQEIARAIETGAIAPTPEAQT